MVVEEKTDPSSSVVLTDESPKVMKFGLFLRTVSLVSFIRQRVYTLALYLLDNLLLMDLIQVGVGSLCLEGILLM